MAAPASGNLLDFGMNNTEAESKQHEPSEDKDKPKISPALAEILLCWKLGERLEMFANRGIFRSPEQVRNEIINEASKSCREEENSTIDYSSNVNALSELTCPLCRKRYSTKTTLNTHLKTVHGQKKPYTCDYCAKSFALKQYLQKHERTHTGIKPYSCEICYKSFVAKSSLNTHMKTIHSEERPFNCERCGKSFKLRNYLSMHERQHTGEKPYWCSSCFKSFTSKSTLNTHIKSFHTVES